MKWGKIKQALEDLLADSVKDHVQYHMTTYGRRRSGALSRAWIAWDKKELVNMSNVEWLDERYALKRQIQTINDTANLDYAEQHKRAVMAWTEAEGILQKKGMLSRDLFVDATEEYLGLSIESALQSDNPIIKAIAMFDRRLGKRRLIEMELDAYEHPLVKQFYILRCQAVNLQSGN